MAQRLVATIQRELGPHDRLHLERDDVRRGNWPVAEACLRWGISEATTHVVLMNDDALPCPGFVEGVRAALSAQPSEFISFYPNDETELDAWERVKD